MSLLRRSGSRKKSTKKRSARRKRRTGGSLVWVLGAAVVAVILGVGMLKWSQSGRGQAALLSLGSDKMYGDVQAAVDSVLAATLPDFKPGLAVDPHDFDWPAPNLGAGASIRCRRVSTPADESWWEIQRQIAVAVAPVGARVLWGERLIPEGLRPDQRQPNEMLDLLRLDVGVKGRPTHTLVLVRAGHDPTLRWGSGAESTRWRDFSRAEAPTVALIIDDWGHGRTGPAMSLLDLPVPITMAVLPHLPYSRYFSLQGTELVLPPDGFLGAAGDVRVTQARRARIGAGCLVEVSTGRQRVKPLVKRREIMLHLPMQPQGYPKVNPGPNPLLVGMSVRDIRSRLDDALASLPSVTGVNNHMGSAATCDEPTMRAFMSVLKGRDLFFVDSLTSARSVAYAEALRAEIPAARNRIFLDAQDEDEVAIARNLARLVQAARASGFAVGIGHPHPATAKVLRRETPRLVAEGVRFVTMSEFLAVQATASVSGAGS